MNLEDLSYTHSSKGTKDQIDDQCVHFLVESTFEPSVADGSWAFVWGKSMTS